MIFSFSILILGSSSSKKIDGSFAEKLSSFSSLVVDASLNLIVSDSTLAYTVTYFITISDQGFSSLLNSILLAIQSLIASYVIKDSFFNENLSIIAANVKPKRAFTVFTASVTDVVKCSFNDNSNFLLFYYLYSLFFL